MYWQLNGFEEQGIPDGHLQEFSLVEDGINLVYDDAENVNLYLAAKALQELYGEYSQEAIDISEYLMGSLLSEYPDLWAYYLTQDGFGVDEYYSMLYAVCEEERYYAQFPIDSSLDIENPIQDSRLQAYPNIWNEWLDTDEWDIDEYDMILFAILQEEKYYTQFPIDNELDIGSVTKHIRALDYKNVYDEWLYCDEWGTEEYYMIMYSIYQAEQMTEEVQVPDKTNPDHYKWIPGVECKQVTDHLNFNLGSAFKYIYRNGRKPTETSIEDLRKAIKFIEFEIERLENEND